MKILKICLAHLKTWFCICKLISCIFSQSCIFNQTKELIQAKACQEKYFRGMFVIRRKYLKRFKVCLAHSEKCFCICDLTPCVFSQNEIFNHTEDQIWAIHVRKTILQIFPYVVENSTKKKIRLRQRCTSKTILQLFPHQIGNSRIVSIFVLLSQKQFIS